MDCLAWLLYLFVLTPFVLSAPPTRKAGGYGKPVGAFDFTKDTTFHQGHHQHHFHSKQQQQQQQQLAGTDDQGWFNGQAPEPAVEWPEESDNVDDDGEGQHHHHHHHHHHQQQQQQQQQQQDDGQQNGQDVEGSAGPWVGLADSAVWPDSKKKAANSWPTAYGSNGNGKRNGKNGKTTAAPTWPPKPLVPQGGWPDPSSAVQDDSIWPDSPAIQLHKKFHGAKNGNGKPRNGGQDHHGVEGLGSPKVPSWSDGPIKDGSWPTPTRSNGNGNGKKNGNQQHDGSHHTNGDKSAILGWDQIPTGYAQKRPTWTKKKDHVIKFKESKFSQTDYTAPADDKAADGAWVEDDDEEAGWIDEGVSRKQSWPTKTNGAPNHHHTGQRGGTKLINIKSNGRGGSGVWRDGPAQSWSRAPLAKHAKWTNGGNQRSGGDPQGAGSGQHTGPQGHHQHHQQGHHSGPNGGASLSNGWLDLQKELYLLKNKVRVSSSNSGWPNVGGPKDGSSWKQQWSSDQEPSSAATRMVTKVVFAESLPKGEKMMMRWTPPVSYQVTN